MVVSIVSAPPRSLVPCGLPRFAGRAAVGHAVAHRAAAAGADAPLPRACAVPRPQFRRLSVVRVVPGPGLGPVAAWRRRLPMKVGDEGLLLSLLGWVLVHLALVDVQAIHQRAGEFVIGGPRFFALLHGPLCRQARIVFGLLPAGSLLALGLFLRALEHLGTLHLVPCHAGAQLGQVLGSQRPRGAGRLLSKPVELPTGAHLRKAIGPGRLRTPAGK